MLTVFALTLCGFAGLGCTEEDPIGPPRPLREVEANTVITADTLCVRGQFTITGTTTVTTLFPNRSTCGAAGLVLIRGTAAVWQQNPNRRQGLFVRLLNTSGQTLQLPVRVYLPPTGTTVVAPAGTPASKVVPLTPDSTDATGGSIWFIGGTGTLAANDSTVQDTLKFNVQSPVTQARFQFQASAAVFDTARPPIPNSMLFPIDTTVVIAPPGDTLTHYFRYLVGVRFDDTTSGVSVQQYIQQFNAAIVAGSPVTQEYILQIPDPGASWTSFKSVLTTMRSFPGIKYADPITSQGGLDFQLCRASLGIWTSLASEATPSTWRLPSGTLFS